MNLQQGQFQRLGRCAVAAFYLGIVTILLFPTNAFGATVAYWRFEEGTAGTQPADTNEGNDWSVTPILDSSGNDYHMRTWAGFTAPTYTTNVPVGSVLQTGAANNLAFDFTPNHDIFASDYHPNGLTDMSFPAFTVEASFSTDTVERWQAIVGKDGQPPGHDSPPFVLKVRDDNDKVSVEMVDANGDYHVIETIDPVVVGQWYHAAVVSDGPTLSMYLDSLDGNGYVLQSTTAVAGGMFDSIGTWTVGRGMWGGGITDWYDGLIDEVRISDTALAPTQFLHAIPEPTSLVLWLVAVAMAMVATRRSC